MCRRLRRILWTCLYAESEQGNCVSLMIAFAWWCDPGGIKLNLLERMLADVYNQWCGHWMYQAQTPLLMLWNQWNPVSSQIEARSRGLAYMLCECLHLAQPKSRDAPFFKVAKRLTADPKLKTPELRSDTWVPWHFKCALPIKTWPRNLLWVLRTCWFRLQATHLQIVNSPLSISEASTNGRWTVARIFKTRASQNITLHLCLCSCEFMDEAPLRKARQSTALKKHAFIEYLGFDGTHRSSEVCHFVHPCLLRLHCLQICQPWNTPYPCPSFCCQLANCKCQSNSPALHHDVSAETLTNSHHKVFGMSQSLCHNQRLLLQQSPSCGLRTLHHTSLRERAFSHRSKSPSSP